ncbi:hypothetical protein [Paenibacillus silagei]|uniref:Uncharacterized protein n=1 Tax=Paenibacillus silagei TaxID=1670801 RepID=A0ABS4NTJ9_9BACL|nr:hypothetical protein [Paenibacillus silagei]MBP2113387.1 hypothetical protein [Paenibacillus silagei]
MEDLLIILKHIYQSNINYVGKLNEKNLLEEARFANWMSAFIVRRLKRDYFSSGMKIDVITETLRDKFSNISTYLDKLEADGLLVKYNDYVIITELGIFVYAKYNNDNNYSVDYNDFIIKGKEFILKGLSQITINKAEKLFPHGLSQKEIVFVVFLLLNSAVSKESAFSIKETTSGFPHDINPIIKSFIKIYSKLFNDSEYQDVIMQEKEFSNFMRRNTGNGTLGRVFNSYFFSNYQKSNMVRTIYFDLLSDIKGYEAKLKEVLDILFDSIKHLTEEDIFAKNLRELTVSYIVENPLLAHEQLLYFNNVEYRRLLYSIISIIDKEFLIE